ncbi:sensor histidine kinase [Streptomyces virginiae]|uniref:sensor histidine kinase n=1 Tax=Streptomyces virginiae TaxID=1961 RepID=UPI0037875BBC
MRDLLLIALYALLGAGAAGLLGAVALRILRRRSVAVSLAIVAAVAVSAMLAGTLTVAWAMFLSSHDLTVVTLVVATAAAVSMATALLLGRQVVRRCRELVGAARVFGEEGTFEAPTAPAPAEFTALSRELALTSERLAASRERERALEASRRELVAWISHDLRTPLAGLRAMSEALEDGMAADPARYHRQIRTEVDRLNAMVGDLFELSRIHAGALSLTLTRVLSNLLVNAIRHTPADGTVAIAAERRADSVVVSVTDACGGIPEEDLPRVFDTGWRGTPARTPPSGAGLGLAIVRGIVEAHAGHANVHNVSGGCRFELTLPAATG